MSSDLALALELADLADAMTLARFRDVDLVVSTKPDLTPVTEADRSVERALRERITAARPDHGILGEEFGSEGAGAWRWIVDPIDGTKNYVRGIPIWATCIALQHDAEVTVGVVSAPALGRRWWAARGEGAYAGGQRIQVSKVASVADAQMSYDSVQGFEPHGLGERFLDLARRCWRTRGLGDFWSHVLVAEGAVDIAVEPEVSVWDVAAVQVIVEEAGGRFTDLAGAARLDGGSAVSTNGLLHEQVLAALGEV
ncbi:MAG TPA: histidinol-phosphatase [Acidimicrobiales bacterium]|nr:histidinol-phosphatase [Acidimicrobiales bacterium]